MKAYLDTSVLAGLYFPEARSENVLNFIKDKVKQRCLSQLAQLEFYSVAAIKQRTQDITSEAIRSLVEMFQRHITENYYQLIHMTDNTFNRATELLADRKTSLRTSLRTLDALHLASTDLSQATLLTADKSLAKAAMHFNIRCELF